MELNFVEINANVIVPFTVSNIHDIVPVAIIAMFANIDTWKNSHLTLENNMFMCFMSHLPPKFSDVCQLNLMSIILSS